MNMVLKKLVIVSGLGLGFGLSALVTADQKIQDDLVVVGSECVGVDCASGEVFGFDTIRLKENNLRIHFIDTSSSSSFPTYDWQITINESINGGKNFFRIEDTTTGTHPFTILGGAPNDSIYVQNSGNVGFNTTAPVVELHVRDGNSPTLRLEQDASSGFAAQAWDVGGNETNFFVRDATNANQIPFRITAGATNASLFIAADGDVGFETTSPDGMFDIAHPANVNNHAVLVSPVGYLGVNIDNSFLPRGLLDVQTAAGYSKFLVQADGIVGVNTGVSGVPTGLFDIQDGSGTSVFNVTSAGALTTSGAITATGDVCTNSTSPSTCLGTVGGALSALDLGSWTIKENSTTNYLEFAYNGTVHFSIRTDGSVRAEEKLCGKLGTGAEGCHFASSRALKDILETVDSLAVLEKLSSLEMNRWRYKSDNDDSIIHMGVMSEDFHQAFGLNGNTTDSIAMVDAVGVSMASIQALNQQLKDKDREIEKIHSELNSLKRELKEIKALVQLK